MSNEELIKSMLAEIENGYISYSNLHCNDNYGLKMIAEALKNAEKYKWHDLRKNPSDLPDWDCFSAHISKRVYFSDGKDSFTGWTNGTEWFSDGREEWTIKDVMAWREIEPFEVEG